MVEKIKENNIFNKNEFKESDLPNIFGSTGQLGWCSMLRAWSFLSYLVFTSFSLCRLLSFG